MRASIITVGDELLAGDITNTNAAWLADRLDDSGVAVREITTIPDEESVIAARVRDHHEAYDATIVTGGVGGTPDDVTMNAVAAAFDSELAVDDAQRERVAERVASIRERRPEFELDVDAWAATPAAGEPLHNPEGLSPGCVVESVYVFPGIPDEMTAMFRLVAPEFRGEGRSLALHVTGSESDLVGTLETVREEFGVAVGCYPAGEVKRIKLSGDADAPLEDARDWLQERLDGRLVDGDEWEGGGEA